MRKKKKTTIPTPRVASNRNQKRIRRRQKARGHQRFLPIVAAPEMAAETAARERRDPSPPPAVEGGNAIPRSADNLPTPRVGADASAPPAGGAPPRPSTPAPAVASSSEGEAPAAPDNVANVVAPSEQATGAINISDAHIETGDCVATASLMRVKEEMAMAKVGGEAEKSEETGSRNAKGGDDEDATVEVLLSKDVMDGGRPHTGRAMTAESSQRASMARPGESGTGGEMLRIPAVSQDAAEAESHAAGIPSYNDPALGLVGKVEPKGVGGTGGRYALLMDEDVVEDARLSGGNEEGEYASSMSVGEWPGLDDADGTKVIVQHKGATNLSGATEQDENRKDTNFFMGGKTEKIEEMEEHEEIVIEEDDNDDIGTDESVGNDFIWTTICEDMAETPPNLSMAEMEMLKMNGVRQAGMKAIYRQRFHANGGKYGEQKKQAEGCRRSNSTTGQGRQAGGSENEKTKKKALVFMGGSEGKERDPKDRMDESNLERVRAREGTSRVVRITNEKDDLMGLPEVVELVDEEEEGKRGKKRRTRQSVEGQDVNAEMKEVGASTPKPSGPACNADGSKAKTGGMFVDEKGRRKAISEEESARYTDVANDSELIDRKFCESYEHLLASVKCTMAKCMESGCVLKVFTKGHDFKDTTTAKARGSVKGTKCGKSATFGTCLQQWFGLGILDDLSRQAKARVTSSSPPMPEQSKEERMKAEQRGRNDRAIALIAENVTGTLNQVEVLAQQLEMMRDNARRMKVSLDDAVRRRDAGEDFDISKVAPMNVVQAPASHSVAFNPAPPVQPAQWHESAPTAAPLGLAWPSIANAATPLTKAQRADQATVAEKDAFRATYAGKVRQKTKEMELRRKPSLRRRSAKSDAEELVAIGVSNMAHEDASIIREDLRMLLTDGVRVLHVRYLQENHMELVTPRHQEQALKNQLIAVGYKVMSGYSPLSMQVRREIDEEKRARRNAYCAARALERAIRGNLGRSVSAYYENLLAEVKGKFPKVFTAKGQDEFNLEYGVRVQKEAAPQTSKTTADGLNNKARDNSVPSTK